MNQVSFLHSTISTGLVLSNFSFSDMYLFRAGRLAFLVMAGQGDRLLHVYMWCFKSSCLQPLSYIASLNA